MSAAVKPVVDEKELRVVGAGAASPEFEEECRFGAGPVEVPISRLR